MASKCVVVVTKFDNPYQFWFRRQEDEQRRILLEDSWTQSMRNSKLNGNYKAEVGINVLVKNGNFKRAIVESISGREYTCWLIDEGVSHRTDRVYQIDRNIASNPKFAMKGGLNSVVAAETRFDFTTCMHKVNFAKFWTAGSIKLCQDFISEATSIVFIKEAEIDGVGYGQLLLTDKSGIPTSLAMELVEKKLAIINVERFHKELNLAIEDTAVNYNEDGLSMITTPIWDKTRRYNKPGINVLGIPKPSGLNNTAIKAWLLESNVSKEQYLNATTIDSDDSSKPSYADRINTSIKSPINSTVSRIRSLLKHKYSLNVSDDLNLQTSSGAIRKRPQTTPPDISPKSRQIAQCDNILVANNSKSDWPQIDTSIILSKGSTSIKSKVPFDTSPMVPAGYNLSHRFSSQSDVQSKRANNNSQSGKFQSLNTQLRQSNVSNLSKISEYSGGSSSCDRSSNPKGQKRLVDSYQFDKRPISGQIWQHNMKFDGLKLDQCNDSKSINRPVNVIRSADACCRPPKQLPQISGDINNWAQSQNIHCDRSKMEQCNKNRCSDRPVNVIPSVDALYRAQVPQIPQSSASGYEKVKKHNSARYDNNKVLKGNLDSDCSSFTMSSQGPDLSITEDPAYDSWDENVAEVEVNKEKQRFEIRSSSISWASTSQVIKKESKSELPSNGPMALDSALPKCAAPTDNNSQYVQTNAILSYRETINNNSSDVMKCLNLIDCNCSKCKAWKECENFGPDVALTFTENTDNLDGIGADKKGIRGTGDKRNIIEDAIQEKPEPLLRVDSHDRKNIVIETVASTQAPTYVEGSKMKRSKVPPVLVHCSVMPIPALTLTSVPGFLPTVVEALRLHKYRDAKPLQVYGWPAATSGEHVLLVGGPITGKTLTHVPTVASVILGDIVRNSDKEKWGREREPTVIILCTGSKKSDEIYDLYCKLVGRCDHYRRLNVALAIPPLDKQYQDQFNNKVDILVTTPIILCKLLSSHVLNLKSLNILILEDLDILLTRFQKEIAAIEHLVTVMLDKRTFSESVQLIMTSEHWTGAINKFVSRLNAVPFICISDPMEAAFYGKAKAQIHIADSVGKSFHLKELIKDSYHLYKTVVVCNTVDEISDIEEIFRSHAVSFTTATIEMEGHDISNVEIEWYNTVPGDHKVLLCDEGSLMNYFSIRNAMTLVHYSLPPISWKMFTQRFRCLFDSYSSPLVPQTNKANCQIHIYLGDKSQKQLSKLINCFKEMGAVIPQAFVELSERAHIQTERLKLTTATPICAHLKLTGQCLTPASPCHHRHIVDHRVDRSKQKYGHLPKQGPITFRLLNVVDTTTYYVRLLNDSGGGWARKASDRVEVDKEYGELVVEMQMALRIEGNRISPQHGAKIGKCYIFEENDKSLRRCRVTKIIDSDPITQFPSIVEAFLLDDGVFYPKIVAGRLFNMPQSVKKIPYLAVEIRLANIVPPGRDNAFSLKILADVKHLLEKNSSNTSTCTTTSTPHYYTGVVLLQLGNCLWVDDVRLMRYLRKTGIHLTSLILKNEIIGNFWGEVAEEPMKRLRELCLERKLSVPVVIELKKSPMQQIIEQITPQWAFLETNTWNKVNFSAGEKADCIYVNLDKFKKQLSDLHSFILQQVNRPFYPTTGEITPGRYYLAPDTDQENTDMCRVLVTDLINEKRDEGIPIKLAVCFLVDYGNTDIYKVEKLLYLRDDMISKLPFQAIECSFHGFKYPNVSAINTSVMNVVDEYVLEDDTMFLRDWYIHAVQKHTVYSACNYFQNKEQIEHVKGTPSSSPTSRFTYSIHAYLENELEICSLNYILGETDTIGLQCLNDLNDLIATDEAEGELLDMIVRGRQARGSDEEEMGHESEQLNETYLQQFNSALQETNGQNLQNLAGPADFDDFNEDDDIQIINKAEFIKQMKANAKPKKIKATKVPAIVGNNSIHTNSTKNPEDTVQSSSASDYTPMVAYPVRRTDGVLTPELVWHQTNSYIDLEVNVLAVQQYKVILLQGNRMMFSATTADNKRYSLNLKFFQKVENCKHILLGLCVRIKLEKLEELEWPRLLFTKQKQSHVKYNVFKIEADNDDDDEHIPRKNRKKFLDLGPEFADIQEPDQFWYNEDSDYDNSESDYAAAEFAD